MKVPLYRSNEPMLAKLSLVVLPHSLCNPVSHIVRLPPLSPARNTIGQVPTHSRFKLWIIEFFIFIFKIIRVVVADEVVQGSESSWKADLGLHVVFWWDYQNTEVTLHNAEDSLDYVACGCMTQIGQFLWILGSVNDIISKLQNKTEEIRTYLRSARPHSAR